MRQGKRRPRDSDMQERALGRPLDIRDDVSLVCSAVTCYSGRGHVAIACDAGRIVHANAFHMAVAIEPVAEAMRRIAKREAPC